MSHTPIPWKFEPGLANTEPSPDIAGSIVGANEYIVADVYSDVPTLKEAGAHNARLIVRAVNAHDELLRIAEAMTALVRLKYGNLEADVYAEIERAEALFESLSKAKATP